MPRTLSKWLNWQQNLHLSSIDLGLERVGLVAKRLKLSNLPFPIISVAGTNGKGSSIAMLQSIYQKAGYKTGVYTSPHLLRYNERIVIGGEEVSDRDICEVFEKINQARAETTLTYFEFGTLAAACLFVQAQIDIAIFEMGLGGRLDAVNLWDADLALITTIAIDHENWLGNTREKIAIEKAGIMRPNQPVICGDKKPPVTIASEAKRIGAKLLQRNQDFSLVLPQSQQTTKTWQWLDNRENKSLKLPFPSLKGNFQLDNAANVITGIMQLQRQLPVSLETIKKGLSHSVLAGRLQIISICPEILLDVAHNPQAAEQLALYLHNNPISGKTIALFSVLNDKDLKGITAPFNSLIDQWYIISLEGERGQCATQLKSKLEKLGINNTNRVNNNFKKTMQDLINTLECKDRLVVFGSFLLVSSVLKLF